VVYHLGLRNKDVKRNDEPPLTSQGHTRNDFAFEVLQNLDIALVLQSSNQSFLDIGVGAQIFMRWLGFRFALTLLIELLHTLMANSESVGTGWCFGKNDHKRMPYKDK